MQRLGKFRMFVLLLFRLDSLMRFANIFAVSGADCMPTFGRLYLLRVEHMGPCSWRVLWLALCCFVVWRYGV